MQRRMNLQEKLAEYIDMGIPEKIYKDLFQKNPDVYFCDQKGKYYSTWEEFIVHYAETMQRRVDLPKEAPTLFGNEITEKDFFEDPDRSVNIVFNARYCPPFWHDLKFIKIMYVLNGELEVNFSQNKKIRLEKGNFIIVPPNIMQSVFSWHDEDVVVNVFLRLSTFEKTFSTMLFKAGEISAYFWQILYGKDESNIIVYRGEEKPFISNLIFEMAQEQKQNQSGGDFLMVSYVMTFFGYVVVYLRQMLTSCMDTKRSMSIFSEIIQYIVENYSTVTLSSLSEHFDKSEGHLSRLIKEETGFSFVQLLKHHRMHQAGILLRETNCSIEAVMLAVGYGDISYFYKAFKKHYGMTPKEYREKKRIGCYFL